MNQEARTVLIGIEEGKQILGILLDKAAR